MSLQGFFTEITPEILSEKRKKEQKKRKRKGKPQEKTCNSCGLFLSCNSPKFPVIGEGKKEILIVGECPSSQEDISGIQNQGQSSQLLRSELKKRGINLDTDCWKTNAVICHPSKGTPTKKQISICREVMLNTVLKELKPKLIFALGSCALNSLLKNQTDIGEFTKWRGLIIHDQDLKTILLPLYHPSYILKKNKDKFTKLLWVRDLKKINKALHTDFIDNSNYNTKVDCLTEYKDVVEKLINLSTSQESSIVFDYETTGIKPYTLGHKILTIGISESKENAYAFPFQFPNSWTLDEFTTIRNLWIKVLQNKNVKKIAHNMKFEDMWTQVILGTRIKGWLMCTLMGQHILDNRGGISGLKHQTYVRYGIYGYDNSIAQYIKSKKGQEFNRMDEAPLNEVLQYNALDCLFTYWLFDAQYNKEFTDNLHRAYQLFHKGALALGQVQLNGINIDELHYVKEKEKLTLNIEEKTQNLLKSKEATLFFEETGKEILLSSNKDLIHLFFDLLKLEPFKRTKKGTPSVDEKSLENMDNRFVKELVSLRKMNKLKNTYISQITSEIQQGMLHPFFNLHVPRTYRSSSASCNFQNIPVRAKEAKKTIRGGIIPSKGFKLLEVDYGSLEVRVIGCLSKDRVILQYLNDPSTDMHRDQASDIFQLTAEQLKGTSLRTETKSLFVFAEFYGSFYKPCAKLLWDKCANMKIPALGGLTVSEHLEFYIYESFENHMKQVEKRFWKKYSGVRQWQEQVVSNYENKGYITNPFGFIFQGIMGRNNCYNYPVQSTGFHLLLWSLIQFNTFLRKKKLKTKIIGQIHDSIVIDMYPPEEKRILKKLNYIMTTKIRKKYPFIICPLIIDAETTEINQPWSTKKAISIPE